MRLFCVALNPCGRGRILSLANCLPPCFLTLCLGCVWSVIGEVYLECRAIFGSRISPPPMIKAIPTRFAFAYVVAGSPLTLWSSSLFSFSQA